MSYLWKNIFKLSNPNFNTIAALKENPLFKDFSTLQVNKIVKFLHERDYKINEYVFREKQPGLGMYLILEGKIEISRTTKKGRIILANLEKNDFFGELALFNNLERSADAKVLENAKVFGFFQPDLLDIIKSYPDIGTKILFNLSKVLALRLTNTNNELEDLKENISFE